MGKLTIIEQYRLDRQAQLYQDERFIKLKDTMSVCEFGCGSGSNLWVAQKLSNGCYVGIDHQEEQIIEAKNKAANLINNSSTEIIH